MQSSRDYIVLHSNKASCARYVLERTSSDPYDDRRIKSYDQKLHRALTEIFDKHRLTSAQIKKRLSTPDDHTDKNSIFRQISKREPSLGKLLLKRNKLSLLWIAVLSYYQDSAELLVRLGANINEFYGLPKHGGLTKKSTVLHALVQMYPSAWNERFIGMVMSHGANINARESDRDTVLHRAVRNGRVKVTKMLLERGANVDAGRYAEITPLLDAARTSEANELVPLLMRYGADINATDTDGFNALHYLACCSDKQHIDLASFLIEEGLSPCEVGLDKYEPIHAAAVRGKTELVYLFLDHGADVNARGYDDESPMHYVIKNCDNPEMLLTLLERGANIDQKTIFARTALYCLVMDYRFGRGDKIALQKLKILLNFGADMFAESISGSTIFDIICQRNLDSQCVTHILKALALKEAFLQPSTKSKFTKEKYPELWDRYQACVEEVNRIRSTRFMETCTIFELLTKCQCEVAALMRHRKFQSRFRQFDLSVFPIYSEDVLEAFERSERYYQCTMDRENLIDDATSKILPYTVVRKIARYTSSCEICKLQNIVQSSKGILS